MTSQLRCGVDYFIHLVENTPITYDKRLPDFKDSALKHKAWKDIGEKCKMTGKIEHTIYSRST